ncbi:MAG TPA: hypothetical protein VK593_04900 [Edaphobacter sp.]|nr:hypothetical protein [Edaphobacter sp.]
MKKGLYLPYLALTVLVSQPLLAQTPTPPTPPTHAPATPATHKAKAPAAAAKAGASAWTPDVQQYLGVQQNSFTLVGLNRLSKAQLDALVSAAKNNLYGDPRKHVLTCGPATPPDAGKVRVLVTVSGDDATGQRSTEIRQAIGAIDGVQLVDGSANADRALHVVIQEQTLGKRTIGYTASYMTATPCTDDSRKTDAELKGQLGTYTDPKGVDLANDLARMLGQDLQSVRSAPQ